MPKTSAAIAFDAGASPARADVLGMTALHYAARDGRASIAKLLVARGATRAPLAAAVPPGSPAPQQPLPSPARLARRSGHGTLADWLRRRSAAGGPTPADGAGGGGASVCPEGRALVWGSTTKISKHGISKAPTKMPITAKTAPRLTGLPASRLRSLSRRSPPRASESFGGVTSSRTALASPVVSSRSEKGRWAAAWNPCELSWIPRRRTGPPCTKGFAVRWNAPAASA